MGQKCFSIIFSVIILLSVPLFQPIYCEEGQKVHLILIWYEGVPFYGKGNISLPLLRNFLLEEAYPLGIVIKKFPNVRSSIAISPSLIIQIKDFENESLSDLFFVYSSILARGENLTPSQVFSLLTSEWGIFGGYFHKLLGNLSEYQKLYKKFLAIKENAFSLPEEQAEELLYQNFTKEDLIYLCSVGNLYSISPDILKGQNSQITKFFTKDNFTANDLREILRTEMKEIEDVIQLYLAENSSGNVEIVASSYAPAVLPLLYDLGLKEDVLKQMEWGISYDSSLFNRKIEGFWFPEMAVNKEVLSYLPKLGINWTVLSPGTLGVNTNIPYYLTFQGKKLFLFIESIEMHRVISEYIEGSSPSKAANMILEEIKNESSEADGGIVVLPIPLSQIFDYFGPASYDFIYSLYSGIEKLQESGQIVTVAPSQYLYNLGGRNVAKELSSYPSSSRLCLENVNLSKYPYYSKLPVSTNESFPEYSYYGDLSNWIGSISQNVAWEFLRKTRAIIGGNNAAIRYIIMAESSQIFYHLGKELLDPMAKYYNQILQEYLIDAYKAAGLSSKIPEALKANCFLDTRPYSLDNPEKISNKLQFIQVDGNLKEWANYYLYSSKYISLYLSSDGDNLNIGIKGVWKPTYVLIGSSWYDPNASYFPIGIAVGFGVEAMVNLKNSELVKFTSEGSQVVGKIEEYWGNVTELKIPLKYLGYVAPLQVYVSVYFNSTKTVFPYPYLGCAWYDLPIKGRKKIVAYFMDPAGDDRGPGTYVYPQNSMIKRGDFDLLSFKVWDTPGYVIFESTFRTLGGNPLKAPYGFSFQVIQIYVEIGYGLGTSKALPGPNVSFKDFTWDFVIQITGWPSSTFIEYYNGVKIHDVIVGINGTSIYAYIPAYEIGHPQKGWKYAVIVGGFFHNSTYSGWMNISLKAGKWTFGGGDPRAIKAGVAPRAIDILDIGDQYSQLSSYNVTSRSLAKITGLSFPPPTPTPTPTPAPQVTPSQPYKLRPEYIGAILAIIFGGAILAYVLLRRR